MSKGNRHSTQSLLPKSPQVQERRKLPIPVKTKNGIELHCPFCDDEHILRPDMDNPCGTHVEVVAVQEVIGARYARHAGIVCLKCHQPGGEMVKYRDSYVHLANCSPGTRLLQDVPKFSFIAKIVHKSPAKIRGLIERLTGRADKVLEIDKDGNTTGKVIGYFFYKKSLSGIR